MWPNVRWFGAEAEEKQNFLKSRVKILNICNDNRDN